MRKTKLNWRPRPKILPEDLIRREFTERVICMIRPETRSQLVSIAYLRGLRGTYAPVARDFIVRWIRAFVAELDPEERREYDNILASVSAGLDVARMERKKRLERDRAIEKAMWQERDDAFVESLKEGDPGEEP